MQIDQHIAKMNNSLVANFEHISDGSFPLAFDVLHVKLIYITLYCAIFLCCVLGNLTVIYVILRHRKMRNVTNFFLANLAVSDLCVGVFCVLPNLSTYLSTEWYLGRVMCKLYYFVQCTSYTASVLILTVISLERYFAIIHPMLNRRLTRMYLLRGIIITVWIFAALYGLPYAVVYDVIHVRNETDNSTVTDFCVIASDYNLDMEIYSIINFVLLYLLPLMFISGIYIRISVVLWRTSRTGEAGLSSMVRNEDSPARGEVICPQCGRSMKPKQSSIGDPQELMSDENHQSKCFKVCWTKTSKWARPIELDLELESICQCPRRRSCPNIHSSRKTQINLQSELKPKSKTQRALITRRKVIRLLICIIVLFALCVLPHHVRILWQYWSSSASVTFWHMLVPPSSFLFFYINSALNPFLYALLSDHFRKAFKDLMPHRCCTTKPMFREQMHSRESRMMRTVTYTEAGTTSGHPRPATTHV